MSTAKDSLKLGIFVEMFCCGALPRNPIAVLTPYQKIDDLAPILTLISAMAERIMVEISV